ncbi:sensor histidine kinase [Microbacterium sp. MPKO10]|uniref:sensor histidine kinase n=1 Tax=Microbacterium sp. MPKO10 TaxID=2989818 RepID=UPI0022369C16|nr:histidine kinase [Microbacterium sp. MPKO10]MCW4459034.1 histidine kinase [Microbacterium sp. MPKO10]
MTERTRAASVASTAWRRLLVLLIGGLVALPYGAIAIWVLSLWAAEGVPAYVRWSSIAIVVLLIIPAVLPVTRALERTVAAQLLDTAIVEPRRRATLADTARGALFFAGHIASGGILILGIAFVFPLAAILLGDLAAGGGGSEATELLNDVVATIPVDPATVLIGCVIVTALIVAFSIGAGYLLPWYAALLLGPSRDEVRELEDAAARAQRRRGSLARDVHDSVGHALTVSTMQATFARHALENDPDAARAALVEIERVSRGAVAELDYVLSVLRDGHESREEHARSGRTLADVRQLADETRAAGFDVDLRMDDLAATLPASLGREAYRVVQEGITNALRYAATPHVDVVAVVSGGDLVIRIENETTAVRVVDGRGLAGARERVAMLGGTFSARVEDGTWRLTVHVPVAGPTSGVGV